MSSHSGLLYYYDLLGLDRDSLRVHYRFAVNSGQRIPNDAPNFPQLSGLLSSVGNFYSKSGSGFFTGQKISIQNASGLPSDFWSHIFIYSKTGAGRGVLYDSFMTGAINSGYVIGINDANKLYFESFDNNGPFTKTSNIMLGKANVVAAVRSNNLLTFYCYDFNNQIILSDSHSLNGNYVLPASKGVLGGASNPPAFIENASFYGYIDEYLYLQEGLTPSSFKYLVSGLASEYSQVAGPVSYISGVQITGYQTGITGVTGVTGYANQVTGSGLDPFGTGYEPLWGYVAQTGYLTSGQTLTPITGWVVRSITGDPTVSLTIKKSFIDLFNLDEISYLRKIGQEDVSLINVYRLQGAPLNKIGGYDTVLGQFQLDDSYDESQLEVYLNGVAQIATGYTVTGNFYGSGVVLNGDYRLDGFYLDSTGFFNDEDVIIYDIISGTKQRIFTTGAQSGLYENLKISGQLIFFNGQLLMSGIDYTTGATGQFQWINDKLNGVTGALMSFPVLSGFEKATGRFITLSNDIPRRNTQLFMNGQRQRINADYVENSSLDLINHSGIFDTSLTSVYDNNNLFFED